MTEQEWKSKYFYLEEVVAQKCKEIEDFKAGVQTFKCPVCKESGTPFYEVNLQQEIKDLKYLLKTGLGLFDSKLSEEERWIREVQKAID